MSLGNTGQEGITEEVTLERGRALLMWAQCFGQLLLSQNGGPTHIKLPLWPTLGQREGG